MSRFKRIPNRGETPSPRPFIFSIEIARCKIRSHGSFYTAVENAVCKGSYSSISIEVDVCKDSYRRQWGVTWEAYETWCSGT